ncbi:hypothetical protein [Streptomyces sp. NPDC048191]|uniref:hypothetical protein n=1 Tax=Streptomyces sp. NPDC048191 TaxID=3155484 RepID=UPI0033C18F2F
MRKFGPRAVLVGALGTAGALGLALPAVAAPQHSSGSAHVLDVTTTNTEHHGSPYGPVGSTFGGSGKTTNTKTGKAYGTFRYECTVKSVKGRNRTVDCPQTLNTPDGQITLQGSRTMPAVKPATLPKVVHLTKQVTGGTKDYANARGVAHLTVHPVTSARVVIHFR